MRTSELHLNHVDQSSSRGPRQRTRDSQSGGQQERRRRAQVAVVDLLPVQARGTGRAPWACISSSPLPWRPLRQVGGRARRSTDTTRLSEVRVRYLELYGAKTPRQRSVLVAVAPVVSILDCLRSTWRIGVCGFPRVLPSSAKVSWRLLSFFFQSRLPLCGKPLL